MKIFNITSLLWAVILINSSETDVPNGNAAEFITNDDYGSTSEDLSSSDYEDELDCKGPGGQLWPERFCIFYCSVQNMIGRCEERGHSKECICHAIPSASLPISTTSEKNEPDKDIRHEGPKSSILRGLLEKCPVPGYSRRTGHEHSMRRRTLPRQRL